MLRMYKTARSRRWRSRRQPVRWWVACLWKICAAAPVHRVVSQVSEKRSVIPLRSRYRLSMPSLHTAHQRVVVTNCVPHNLAWHRNSSLWWKVNRFLQPSCVPLHPNLTRRAVRAKTKKKHVVVCVVRFVALTHGASNRSNSNSRPRAVHYPPRWTAPRTRTAAAAAVSCWTSPRGSLCNACRSSTYASVPIVAASAAVLVRHRSAVALAWTIITRTTTHTPSWTRPVRALARCCATRVC
mmetsp:Transcript_28448/g.71453  ORF Transcript_28448/g.71453 Transcript_28448/m.71453 type:complete len:240 (-) Transcript_28448:365-1084(-)